MECGKSIRCKYLVDEKQTWCYNHKKFKMDGGEYVTYTGV